MNKSLLKILGLTLLLPISSCEELTLLNENPNEPSIVTPDVLLTAGMRTLVNSSVNQAFLLGNNAAQLTAKTLRTEIDVYDWNAFPIVWEEMYDGLTDLAEAEQLAQQNSNEQLQAVAMIMKVWGFSVLTNAYGDIPYSEALKGTTDGNFTPKYDTQEAIYTSDNGLIANLKTAKNLLNGSGNIAGDIILRNDADKWKKFANSLHLRLLMHLSNKTDVATELADLVAQNNFLGSNDDNVALTYTGNFPNEFPLIPLKIGDFDAVVLGVSAFDVMSNNNDPRISRYARPNDDDYNTVSVASFSGAVNGSENTATCSKSGSRLGAAYYDFPNQTTAATLGISRAQGLLMTYAEVQFLLAEATLKGYIAGDIATYYKTGISASMAQHQVDFQTFGYNDFEDYYNNSGVAYSTATDIWQQKWLALFFCGLEPYFEVRRWLAESNEDFNNLDFLRPTCENINNDKLPVRFWYPGEEASLNTENYQNALQRIGGSNDFNAKMWLINF